MLALAGLRSRSPVCTSPPPITTSSGSNTVTSEPIPTPSQKPSRSNSSMAVASPRWAARKTSSPVTFSGSPASCASSPPGSAERRPGGHRLQAAKVAAVARVAVGVDGHVPDLGAEPGASPVDAPVEHQPAADASADGQQHHVVAAGAGAVARLRPGGGVGVVVDP